MSDEDLTGDRRRHPERPDGRGQRVTTWDGRRTRDDVSWDFDARPSRRRESADRFGHRRRRDYASSRRVPRADVAPFDFDRKGPFGFAVTYPFQRGVGPVLKAGLLTLGSALLLFTPLVFLFGYLFRLTRHAAQGRDQPAFEDYGQMLTDGVGYVVVFTLAGLGWLLAYAVGTELHAAVGATFGLVGAYLFPAVLTVYPVTGSVATTFTSSRALDLAFTGYYVKHLLVFVALVVVLRIVTAVSAFALLVGLAWGWAFSFLATGAYWGFVYYAGARDGVLEPTEQADQRNGF
ncbi:DUF4013 domain-containing protein [Haloarchaeobius sp. HRN-SO-5]|uniref:DUF4013 domain-containing protein n=1 Tax=Haloarchaeobius sp. HRN-SO-5 TaxID=3446118 RepID=UPI003EB8693E